MESDHHPEHESLLNQVRKAYQDNKSKVVIAKTAHKGRFLITSAFIFSVLTGLIMILHFAGLLMLKGR